MVGAFSRAAISLASETTRFQKRAAEQQGGLLDGKDPTEFNSNDPIRLWIIQVGLIIITSQLLGSILKKIREPRVIAEVLGGILLGPTAFGRIPGFTQHIFPEESLPYLSLTANIGLVLFLFLVGLEIETSVIKRNARFSFPIAVAGMVLPFGLGAALAVPIWDRYIGADTSSYSHFMVFTGVAFSITAFPVLCRILTELKLVDTTVGIVVLSAGVGNDIVGWTLLALAVALVNAAAGLSALWILLTAVGWTLFLLIPVKWAFKWLARRTGSIENGPTMTFMTATMLMTFGSAFFTDIIGVHAIFGGFLAGLVVPRDGGLAIQLTEKLEDMVSIIFLPLYFTLSGLSTNLGLLDDGITWAYTIAICGLAFFGKFGGCSIAARFCGFKWREAATIGSLMSCKGLVELIVLNVGLNANILTPRVFSMFVFEALLLTCLTTPLVLVLYPPDKRSRAVEKGPNYLATTDEEGKTGMRRSISRRSRDGRLDEEEGRWKTRFTVVLDKIEHLPGMMALTQLVCSSPARDGYVKVEDEEKESEKGVAELRRRKESARSSGSGVLNRDSESLMAVDALRLIELSDRTSAVMKSTAAASEHQLILSDPLLNVFRTFSELNGLEVSSSLSVVTFTDLAHRVADRARDTGSQLVLVPWLPATNSYAHQAVHASVLHSKESEGQGTGPTFQTSSAVTPLLNPFDILFRTPSYGADKSGSRSASIVHSQFVRAVFAQCRTDVALYVDLTTRSSASALETEDGRASTGSGNGNKQHIFLPFFGGPDDRLALEFVVQLCANPKNNATIVRITKSSASELEEAEDGAAPGESGENSGGLMKLEKAHTKGDGERLRDAETLAAVANIRANGISVHSTYGMPDTVYGAFTTQTRLQSETADNITWARYASPSPDAVDPLPPRVTEALSRVTFRSHATPRPLHYLIDEIASLSSSSPPSSSSPESVPHTRGGKRKKLVVVLGRSRRLAIEDHSFELKELLAEHGSGGMNVGGEVRKTVGDVASAVIGRGCGVGDGAAVVIMQAAHRSLDDE